MADRLRVVVIGGVAAGPKIAAKIMRLNPNAQVTLVDKGELLSYAGCGLPYFISGDVKKEAELTATPIGVPRDCGYFRTVKNFDARTRTEALEIDRAGKRVRARNLDNGTESWLEYDRLAIATGASVVIPPIPGVELPGVFALKTVEDSVALKERADRGQLKEVVIAGGGLIGLESAEAFAARGAKVTIVEMLPQILGPLDWEMAKLVEKHLADKGVRLMLETPVESIEGNGKVEAVVAGGQRLPADTVLISVGVRPNAELAKNAGLDLGPTGAIQVDEYMRTSDPDIYAAGDCVEVAGLVSGKPEFIPLGSTANKQGRVAAINICGGGDRFPALPGSTVCKVFDYAVGFTGLSERAAREQRLDVVTCLIIGPDKADYYPTKKTIMLKMVANRATRKLLGLQAIGAGVADKRIDVAATAIAAGMTVDQVAHLDLCYAPPYSPAMDIIITAANVIRNKIDGQMDGLPPMAVKEKIDAGENFVLLDVRSPSEFKKARIGGSVNIPLGTLRERHGELPRDKEIVTYCGSSLRAYEAALILRAAGFDRVRVLDGSIGMWPFEVEK